MPLEATIKTVIELVKSAQALHTTPATTPLCPEDKGFNIPGPNCHTPAQIGDLGSTRLENSVKRSYLEIHFGWLCRL